MGRNYDSAGYLEAVARLRERVPHVNLTTDVIVGYPTEDEAAFERTLDLVREAGITRVHTFSFSARPGTEADRLGDPVPPAEKKRRSRELRGLSEALSAVTARRSSARIEEVLVDKVADTQASGYSRDYTRLLPARRFGAGGGGRGRARSGALLGRLRGGTPLGHEAELVRIDDQTGDAGTVRGQPVHHPCFRRHLVGRYGCRGRRPARSRSAGSTPGARPRRPADSRSGSRVAGSLPPAPTRRRRAGQQAAPPWGPGQAPRHPSRAGRG